MGGACRWRLRRGCCCCGCGWGQQWWQLVVVVVAAATGAARAPSSGSVAAVSAVVVAAHYKKNKLKTMWCLLLFTLNFVLVLLFAQKGSCLLIVCCFLKFCFVLLVIFYSVCILRFFHILYVWKMCVCISNFCQAINKNGLHQLLCHYVIFCFTS